MNPHLVTFIFFIGIAGLFAFDRDKDARTSKALWIPVAWLLINCSRSVSQWLAIVGFGGGLSGTDKAQSYLDGSPADRNVFIFLLLAGFIALAHRASKATILLRKSGSILLFYLYSAVSILWSAYPFIAFKHWIKGIGDVVMVLIVLTDPQPVPAIKRLLSRVGFILLPVSVLLIKYVPELGRAYSIGGASQYTGVTTQKNTLGVICLVFGLGSLYRFISAYKDRTNPRRKYLLTAHGCILVMAVWLLRTCDSMTSLSCFVMAGVIMALANSPKTVKRPVRVHILVAFMVSISFFALFFESGGGLLKGVGRDATLTGRTEIWKAVLPLAGNPFVGTGYESFWLGDRLTKLWTKDGGFFIGINEAHNGYLEVYLNLGWIGIGMMAVIIVAGYRKVMSAYQYNPAIGALGVAYFAAELCYNFTEAGFRMMYPLWFFFLLSILMIGPNLTAEVPSPAPLVSEVGRPKRLLRPQPEEPEIARTLSRY